MRPLLAEQPRTDLGEQPPRDRAFERMYRRHVGDVYHYALAVLHNPADAEDVTQTTFMNAYRAYQQGQTPRAPQNWLITIAHNVCRQRFRQSLRRPAEVAFDDGVAEAVPDEDAPSVQDIRRALSHLAFNQRAALVMRELEGRSYAEIAETMSLSVGAVETLIFRARQALREQLEGGLTCGEAERAISRQLDGRLSRHDRGALRAHLRECSECATYARRYRAQRAALRGMNAIPLPASLSSFFGGGATGGAVAGAVGGTGLAAKAAAVAAAGVAAAGATYKGVEQPPWRGVDAGTPTAARSDAVARERSATRARPPAALSRAIENGLRPRGAAPARARANAVGKAKAKRQSGLGQGTKANNGLALGQAKNEATRGLGKARGKAKALGLVRRATRTQPVPHATLPAPDRRKPRRTRPAAAERPVPADDRPTREPKPAKDGAPLRE